ncbi:MAG: hypothetical protein ACJAT7_000743 [Psychromonas sp.]|jgi:hypothetical protein|uniref:YecA family protein n=1 Tax=Psychromonas sp. TaxID=1884585 RepID=UPI0039E42F5D
MNENYAILTSTLPCYSAVQESAAKLDGETIISLLELAIENSDPEALKMAFWLAAFNKLAIPPALFCQGLTLLEDLTHIAPLVEYQPINLVPHLLQTANDGKCSLSARVWASCIAATFIIDQQQETAVLSKILQKLKLICHHSLWQYHLDSALCAIEHPEDNEVLKFIFRMPLSELLPASPPHKIIGGSYTMRRAVEKQGRNEPCHCGSGKKYKKCCREKDQALQSDASAYQGITQTELKKSPGLVNKAEVIYDLKLNEIKVLKADKLGDKQLFPAFRQACEFNLWLLAYEMLLACEQQIPDFDTGHFDDLLRFLLNAEETQLAHKLQTYCLSNNIEIDDQQTLLFDILENPQHYQKLEHLCLEAVTGQTDCILTHELTDLAYDFADHFPSLALVFARAAIVSQPENHFDNEALLEIIQGIRIDLDIDPWLDPVEPLLQWQQDNQREHHLASVNNAAMDKLSEQLKSTRLLLKDKQYSLQALEKELQHKDHQLLIQTPQVQPVIRNEATDNKADSTISRLRDKVAILKGEIGVQQDQRKQLKNELKQERENNQATLKQEKTPLQAEPNGTESELELAPSGKLVVPIYSDNFSKSCLHLPENIARKALIAAGRFAGHDHEIWRQTKRIKRLSDYYRIRINRDYRLLLHWQAGKVLTMLDIIPRQELENWIKRH